MLYRLTRDALFRLDAETAHALTLATLQRLSKAPLSRLLGRAPAPLPRTVLGIHFPSPIGLAAGLDKNGAYLDGLARLGFGFIEVGTVTPRPQPGNPRPRLFRLPKADALINRMGFNNQGIEALLRNLERSRYAGVLGINIGKNRDTPLHRASEDYIHCLRRVYAKASYVTVNISSPNTPGLRELQHGEALSNLLRQLKREQSALADAHGNYVPLLVKVAPDLDEREVSALARTFCEHRVDGVVATNTTNARPGVQGLPLAAEAGGLSGRPLAAPAVRVLRLLVEALDGALPIVGVGGIMSGQDAHDRLRAGATLLQIYTGLIYRGPALLQEIATVIAARGNEGQQGRSS